MPGVTEVAESNGSQPGALLAEGVLVLAQLRDVLAAEDSTPVAQKHYYRRLHGPQ